VAVLVRNLQKKIQVEDNLVDVVTQAAHAVLENELREGVELSIAFVDDEFIRDLNLKYRGVDAATDVLSFAQSGEGETGRREAGDKEDGWREGRNGDTGEGGEAAEDGGENGNGEIAGGNNGEDKQVKEGNDAGRVESLEEDLLGDVVVSLETAARQAEKYNHSLYREAAFLVVHGTLHLLGYRHDDEESRKKMRDKEEAVLAQLELARG